METENKNMEELGILYHLYYFPFNNEKKFMEMVGIVFNEKGLDEAIAKGTQVYLIANDIVLSSNKKFPKDVFIMGINKIPEVLKTLKKESFFRKFLKLFKKTELLSMDDYGCKISFSNFQMFFKGFKMENLILDIGNRPIISGGDWERIERESAICNYAEKEEELGGLITQCIIKSKN